MNFLPSRSIGHELSVLSVVEHILCCIDATGDKEEARYSQQKFRYLTIPGNNMYQISFEV